VEFTCLRDMLGLTDGNLGAHLCKLEEADHVKITKTSVARNPRTLGGLTFTQRVAALQTILHGEK